MREVSAVVLFTAGLGHERRVKDLYTESGFTLGELSP